MTKTEIINKYLKDAPQSYIDECLKENRCYRCKFETQVIPCSNCGHDAPLVSILDTAPLTAHNQGIWTWL